MADGRVYGAHIQVVTELTDNVGYVLGAHIQVVTGLTDNAGYVLGAHLQVLVEGFQDPEAELVPFEDPVAKDEPVTIDGSASVGDAFRWAWTEAPTGSNAETVDPTALPDAGGSSFISMASNATLYHTTSNLDSSGNANNVTLSNITQVAGKVGGAGSAWGYDTANAAATIGAAVSLAGGSWSAGGWFKGLKANGTVRSFASNAAGTDVIARVNENNKLVVVVGGVETVTAKEMLAADYTDWHHIAVVGVLTESLIYVDGVLAGSATAKPVSDIKTIGNRGTNAERFADNIAEVATWQRALSASEVNAWFSNQAGTYARDPATGYAAVANTLTFTPSKAGAYAAELSSVSASLGGISTSSTTVEVVGGLPPGVLLGERAKRMSNVVGQRNKPHRGMRP